METKAKMNKRLVPWKRENKKILPTQIFPACRKHVSVFNLISGRDDVEEITEIN